MNMEKTKVVVFKNGGFVKASEKWNFDQKQIQVVPSYCYLRVIFIRKKCVQNLSSKALRAMAGIKKLGTGCGGLPKRASQVTRRPAHST